MIMIKLKRMKVKMKTLFISKGYFANNNYYLILINNAIGNKTNV
jgi:hypothetical protein